MEFLKDILEDDNLYTQVVEKLGDKKLVLDDGKLIPKSRFDEINTKYKQTNQQLETQKTDYETQLSEVNNKLTEFEGFSKLTTEQKQQILDLKTKNEKMTQDYNSKLQSMKKDNLIDLALIKDGAIETKEVRVHLDLDKISVDDNDNLIGYEDQVKTVKEKHTRLFGEVKKIGEEPPGGGSPVPAAQKQKEYNDAIKKFGLSSPQAIAAKRRMFEQPKT